MTVNLAFPEDNDPLSCDRLDGEWRQWYETAQSSPDTEGLSTKQLDLQKALATLYLFHLDSADF